MRPNIRVVYFNNCLERDHVRLFGRRAFFDLGVHGRESDRAGNLRRGQRIVVAAPANSTDELTFTWYALEREEERTERESPPDSARKRVFYGPRLFEETLTRVFAARSPRYAAFFKQNGKGIAGRGHLKNGSVFFAILAIRDLPPEVIPDDPGPSGPPGVTLGA